jgi:nucleoside-diphosphate-sugar epimerase
MNILVTGATGFLGRNLIRFLVKEGHTVTAIGRDGEKLTKCFPDQIISKQVTDYSAQSLSRLTKGQEIVVHLASQLMQRDTDPLRISEFNRNLEIVENLMIACETNKIRKFVNISSISVYPREEDLLENQAVNPWNIYGVSKANIDTYLLYIQQKIQTKIVSLRLARLYGYGEREGLLFTDFVEKARNKKALTINGQGKSTIEYIYIEDAVDAIIAVLRNGEAGGVYNVGTGISFSVYEIAEVVNEVFDNKGNVEYLKDRPDGVLGSVMNVSKMKSDLNWEAKWSLLQSVQDIKTKIENER